jgi:hypothetical protein
MAAGSGTNTDLPHSADAAVPEPATLLLALFSSLTALLIRPRRRQPLWTESFPKLKETIVKLA